MSVIRHFSSVLVLTLLSCEKQAPQSEPKEVSPSKGVKHDATSSCRRLAPDLNQVSIPFTPISPPPEHCSQAATAETSKGRVTISVCPSSVGRKIFRELEKGDRPTAYGNPGVFLQGYLRKVPQEVSGLWGALGVEAFSPEGVHDLVFFDFEGVSSEELGAITEKVFNAPLRAPDQWEAAEKARCRERGIGKSRVDVEVVRRTLFER